MKSILLLLSFFVSTYCIDPFSWYWNINTGGDSVTVVKWKNNNDSVIVWANKICDTINSVVPRWNDFSNHDSTFRWMNIDTIGGSVLIDSVETSYLNVTGSISLDTLQRLTLDTIYGNPVIDTISGEVNITGNLKVNTINPLNAGMILNFDDYPNYRSQIFFPYGRYVSAWESWGIRLSPMMIGGIGGTGAFELSFSTDSTDGDAGESIDTLTYTAAITIQKNGYLFFPDSNYIGTTTDKDLVRLTNTKLYISGDVDVDSVICSDVKASNYCMASYFTTDGSNTFTYADTAVYDSLYEASTYRASSIIRLVKIGNIVSGTQQGQLTYTDITADTDVSIRGIPTGFKPIGIQYIPVVVKASGYTINGFASWDGTGLVLKKYDGGYLGAGVSGLAVTTFTWITNE